MAVFYRQSVNGEVGQPQRIAPVDDADTDADLLERKFVSAAANGWEVARLDETSFVAVKTRWADDLCEREFWIE